jgi:hypothetical protein
MQPEPTTSRYENLPEFIATGTYVRCLDRLFQSLPASAQLRWFTPVISAAVKIGTGIACIHADPEPPLRFTAADREASRRQVLAGIQSSRERLHEIERVPGADRAEILVARELLDRIEGSVRATVPPR